MTKSKEQHAEGKVRYVITYLSKTEATTDQGNRRLRDRGVSFRFRGTVPSAEGAVFLGGSGDMLPGKTLEI